MPVYYSKYRELFEQHVLIRISAKGGFTGPNQTMRKERLAPIFYDLRIRRGKYERCRAPP
jgi:hypothetical protein